ncbi:phage virion morphogenesis protein [Roseomonas sp. HJA6]|uniref:Phage virion morphogenesis protein n=1 Tax=Roseomonas alba TaxID=2846776 RepID=A0ABS7AIC4_9PROT|nr:phage virion morphogenesis protein [Neoroseomonas alba]MBW6402073.1 phage virion morphogenesis protein [Neoroseomonas alba]
MTSIVITSHLAGGEVQAAFRHWQQLGRDSTPLMRAIGVGLISNVHDRFAAETDPDGARWAPLKEPWASLRRAGPILQQSGMRGGLMGTITSDAANGEVSVGSNKIYAAVHQFGATIKAKNAPLLIFRTPEGVRFGAARQVTIPARPYLGISAADEDTILDAVEVFWLRFR